VQTSCAFIHRDDVEMWNCNKDLAALYNSQGGRLQNVGFNFGAIGDRADDQGILWMESPTQEHLGGQAGWAIPVNTAVSGASVSYFRHHSSFVQDAGLTWVASSGVEGAERIVIDLTRTTGSLTQVYDIDLVFLEPLENAQPGDRVFDVVVNGVNVGTIDVAAEVGVKKILVKKLSNITLDAQLRIDLTASAGRSVLCGVSLKARPVESLALASRKLR